MEQPEYEVYGMTEEEWLELSEEERESYRGIGQDENLTEAGEDDLIVSEEEENA